jgi:hypothetical protein
MKYLTLPSSGDVPNADLQPYNSLQCDGASIFLSGESVCVCIYIFVKHCAFRNTAGITSFSLVATETGDTVKEKDGEV